MWEPVALSEANGVISGYVVTALNTNSDESDSVTTVTVSTEYTATTEPYSTYLFSVAARTVVGTGPVSPEILVETPEEGKMIVDYMNSFKMFISPNLIILYLQLPLITHKVYMLSLLEQRL